MNIAYFITPHGFGHASRASAVMESILEIRPDVRFELFTTLPQPIFKAGISQPYGYHPVKPDIGLVQHSPMKVDLTSTCDQLDQLLPYDTQRVQEIATRIKTLNCRMVICDIAPLGIVVAQVAGVPSVLIENFTWDWIYRYYQDPAERLKPHITYLADLVSRVNHHIQTPPLCNPSENAVFMTPMSRRPRTNRNLVRKQLGIGDKEKMVLVTMGGIPDRFEFLSKLPSELDFRLVVPGIEDLASPHKNVILLPTHSRFFHPDLMAAADILVGKAGYSTVAEAYHAGTPFGCIKRPNSPESTVLEAFIQQHMPSMILPSTTYTSGQWVSHLPELMRLPRGPQRNENGADQAAAYILDVL